jgi:cobalt-zinc-cadmium efflux system outer membrane protein
MKNKISLAYLLLMSICFHAQNKQKEIVNLTFSKGKEIIINESLRTLSNYYNIDIAEADVVQKKLWNNPTFVWNADMYSVERNTYFEFRNQKLIQLEYIFSISGKRIKAVRQSQLELEIAKHAYSDVIRGYLIEYSNLYSRLSSLLQKKKIYEKNLNSYDQLIKLYSKQNELGMVSLNDLFRLEAEHLTIHNTINDIENQIIETQSTLCSLLNFKSDITIIPIERVPGKLNIFTNSQLIEAAKENRPDFQIMNKNPKLYELELKSQRAQALPDVKLAYQPHDKGSNYVRPYSGMVFEVGLPIFNRNQGEIAKSKVRIAQSKLELDFFTIQLENNVLSSYDKYSNSIKIIDKYTSKVFDNIESLSKNAKTNFENKNINLIQFIDYQNTYLNYNLQKIDAFENYFESMDQLNYEIGKEILN